MGASGFVPGWFAHRRLARGRRGSVYLARSEADGRWAVLRVLRLPPGTDLQDAVAQARHRAAWRDPGLVGAHDVAPTCVGDLAVVVDLAEGGTLAGLRADRGHLLPGELVTVLFPLARTLRRLLARGQAYDDLREGTVLFTRVGRPVLGDAVGVLVQRWWRETQGLRPGPDQAEARLVRRIGALAAAALPGAPRRQAWPLVDLARHCAAPQPRDRPSLDEVARALTVAATPLPLYPVDTEDNAGRVTRRIPERLLMPPEPTLSRPRRRGVRRSRSREQ